MYGLARQWVGQMNHSGVCRVDEFAGCDVREQCSGQGLWACRQTEGMW